MTQVLTSTAREEAVAGTGGLNIFVRSWRRYHDLDRRARVGGVTAQCLHCRRHAPGLTPKAFENTRVRWL